MNKRVFRVALLKRNGGPSWGEAENFELAEAIAWEEWEKVNGRKRPDAASVKTVLGAPLASDERSMLKRRLEAGIKRRALGRS